MFCEFDESPSVPVQLKLYEPVPPETLDVQVIVSPMRYVEPLAEHETLSVGLVTVTEQERLTELPPEVITTVALLVPAEPYEVVTELVLPVASPLHE